ncbi:MAG: APC family permease, partial [Lachnospiraceae bacterium]|nr:APC family permease [Lachnospiraceae bacterium]
MGKAEGSSSDQKKYLGLVGAWALAFGCSVGWGSFVMPGTTFLPIAGPIGTALGLGLGGLVMLLIAVNYHYLMNRYPDGGGAYTYTKKAFGYDHGFLSAWFLILTYTAIIWANATALPLIVRTLFGDTFRFGYLYEIAGYPIYVGELLLAEGALVLAAVICLFRKPAACFQIVMAVLLFVGVVICFAFACGKLGTGGYEPAYAPGKNAIDGVITIFALAPWAFVGFESISHSAAEAKFPLKKSFRVLVIAVITAAIAYILLSLMAVKALPEGCSSWVEYVENLGTYSGVASQPTFHAAYAALGDAGSFILGVAALGAIFTGLIGNFIALSRLMDSLSEDGLFPKWIGKKKAFVPRNAILCILIISVVFPFLGRTAISWIVDVTTVGATIAYALTSASAWKIASANHNRKYEIFGLIGMIVSMLFAMAFLIPNIISVSTLSTESYLILSVWSICGFLYFRMFLR